MVYFAVLLLWFNTMDPFALRPVLTFSKYLGIFPSSGEGFRARLIYMFYGFVLCAVPFYGVYKLLQQFYPQIYNIEGFVMFARTAFEFGFMVAVSVMPIVQRGHMSKLFQKLQQAEEMMTSININQISVPSQKCQISWIVGSLLGLFCPIALSPLFPPVDHTFHWKLYIIITRLIINFRAVGFLLHFKAVITLIFYKYTLLNWHLKDLNKLFPAFLHIPSDTDLSHLNLLSDARDKMFIDPKASLREISVGKLRTFNQIHFLLFSACRRLNLYFSLQNLIVTVVLGLRVMTSIMIFSSQTNIHRNVISLPTDSNMVDLAHIAVLMYHFICNLVLISKTSREVRIDIIIFRLFKESKRLFYGSKFKVC